MKITPFLATLAFALSLLGFSGCSAPKYSGPSDEVIRQQVGETLKTIGAPSEATLNFQITKIVREDVFENDGTRGIPKGTLVFPVKCVTALKEGSDAATALPVVFLFYQDSNGVWKSFARE